MRREFPEQPLIGVGAVVVEEGRVLLVRRGREPLKGSGAAGGIAGGGRGADGGVVREVREETGLEVETVELIELLDRIYREGERVRYHYVIADYLCRVMGGELQAASDADGVRWVERAEWNSHGALKLEPITVRVMEAGWQRARATEAEKERADCIDEEISLDCHGGGWLAVAAGIGFWARPMSYFRELNYFRGADGRGWRADGDGGGGFGCITTWWGPAQDGPVVVLIHGLGGRAEDWLQPGAVFDEAGYRVYMPDLPGYGRSEQPANFSYSVTDEAGW